MCATGVVVCSVHCTSTYCPCKHFNIDSMILVSTADYSLRLVAPSVDSVPHMGRLDVWYGEEWRPVCAGRWGRKEATVACLQLGYKELVTFNSSEFPRFIF